MPSSRVVGFLWNFTGSTGTVEVSASSKRRGPRRHAAIRFAFGTCQTRIHWIDEGVVLIQRSKQYIRRIERTAA